MSGAVLIFVIFVVVFGIAVSLGLYTRRGSGISQRPHDSGRGDSAGGAAGPSRLSTAEDETEGLPDTHGTV